MSTSTLPSSVNQDACYTLEQFEESLDFTWMPSLGNLTSVAGSFDVVAGSYSVCGYSCQTNSYATQCRCY
jgi:hypothetical protein